MSTNPKYKQFNELIKTAKNIAVLQADNPDGDSLASALALEQILHDLGKNPTLYCGIDMPTYLHYLPGWDRVVKDFPKDIDLTIIVDCSSISLFDSAKLKAIDKQLAKIPCIVIDHHDVESTIDFATLNINERAVATGEVIYEIAKSLDLPMAIEAKNMLAVSILSDSLGLMSEGTTPRSIHIIAELVENGVKLAELEKARRELMRKAIRLVRYKGELLQRIEYFSDDRIATITIPWAEIEEYSHAYNPSMLVIDDMRLTENTDIAIAFKVYKDGKVTAKIRCNYGVHIANKLAEHFGGGGHPYASGFKVSDSSRSFEDIKQECIEVTTKLLNEMESDDQAV